MHSHELDQLNLRQVEAAQYTTAVLPIGATEPHNYHLPYGTDFYIVEHLGARAVRAANELGGRVVCLPPIHYGYEGNMRDFPLAINLQPSTLIRIIADISQSLVDSKIKFLFILNGHGGNELKTIIRELNREVDIFICGANWWDSVPDVLAETCPGGGDHANDFETSAILHISPELVMMDQANDGHMNRPSISEFEQGWVKYSRSWKAFAPSSGAGDPRESTAEVGKRLMETTIERLAAFLHKLSLSERNPGFPFASPD